MFRNPLTRAILLSSGSIPVRRNPNSGPTADSASADFHQALFRETFRALDAGEVVGVFPEGTSYTEPQIAQVKDGAARAALEYMRWCKDGRGRAEKAGRPLVIVPVGIVYTDKSQYQSRVCVRWGKPIDIQPFAAKYLSEQEDDSRAIIRSLTSEIEKRMVELTINAPDWDTLYAAKMMRDIRWEDEARIPLKDYVAVMQSLVDILNNTEDTTLPDTKQSLLKYYSLLRHTHISSASLAALFPSPYVPTTRVRAFFVFLRQLATTLLHPRFLLFLPPLLLHIPAYCAARLGDSLLSHPDEEETHAQFKAVLGGVGAVAVYAAVGRAIARAVSASVHQAISSRYAGATVFSQMIRAVGEWMSRGGRARSALGVLVILYGTTWILSKWHNALVQSNYTQFKLLLTSFKILTGILSPASADVPMKDLGLYTVPPLAPVNPFIKRRTAGRPDTVQTVPKGGSPPSVASRRLVRHLLAARAEASSAMARSLD